MGLMRDDLSVVVCFLRRKVRRLAIVSSLSLVVSPALAAEKIVVTEADLVSIGALGWIAPQLKVPAVDRTLPLIVQQEEKDPGARLLKRLEARGRAGDLSKIAYENRDRGHSPLPEALFPSLVRLSYGPKLKAAQLDYGLAGQIIYPFVVIGNSSTAIKSGLRARSQPRLAMTSPGGPERAYLTYSNNHLYVYPEHKDHDLQDMFPANWPYMVISQGSSHSDKPFLQALVMSLAAMPKDTLAFLIDKKLVAPTLQMMLHRSKVGVRNRASYFAGITHPTAFRKVDLAPERMVAMAAALKASDVPPMVKLTIEAEDFTTSAGLAGLSERLYDTPAAIARVWRSHEYVREMTLSAAETVDPNGRDLTFEWVLLRGHPDKVRITLLDGQGSRARIQVRWHDMYPIVPGGKRMTNRIEVGVFAHNGVHDSAPSFVSVSFPSHQKRVYEKAPGGGPVRLISVDYAPRADGPAFDPMLHWTADWRDDYTYDASGELVAWSRITPTETIKVRDPESTGGYSHPVHELLSTKGGARLIMKPVEE